MVTGISAPVYEIAVAVVAGITMISKVHEQYPELEVEPKLISCGHKCMMEAREPWKWMKKNEEEMQSEISVMEGSGKHHQDETSSGRSQCVEQVTSVYDGSFQHNFNQQVVLKALQSRMNDQLIMGCIHTRFTHIAELKIEEPVMQSANQYQLLGSGGTTKRDC
ncbi:hypothetical protein Tco_0663120 [Tanacetum coccineum]